MLMATVRFSIASLFFSQQIYFRSSQIKPDNNSLSHKQRRSVLVTLSVLEPQDHGSNPGGAVILPKWCGGICALLVSTFYLTLTFFSHTNFFPNHICILREDRFNAKFKFFPITFFIQSHMHVPREDRERNRTQQNVQIWFEAFSLLFMCADQAAT